jgi:hypothetical protein
LVRVGLSEEQVAVLLDHVFRGAAHPDVGYADANRTMGELHRALVNRRSVQLEVIESALWSCNLLNDLGAFVHPDGLSFEEFVKKLTPPGKTFDKFFNVFLDSWVKGA